MRRIFVFLLAWASSCVPDATLVEKSEELCGPGTAAGECVPRITASLPMGEAPCLAVGKDAAYVFDDRALASIVRVDKATGKQDQLATVDGRCVQMVVDEVHDSLLVAYSLAPVENARLVRVPLSGGEPIPVADFVSISAVAVSESAILLAGLDTPVPFLWNGDGLRARHGLYALRWPGLTPSLVSPFQSDTPTGPLLLSTDGRAFLGLPEAQDLLSGSALTGDGLEVIFDGRSYTSSPGGPFGLSRSQGNIYFSLRDGIYSAPTDGTEPAHRISEDRPGRSLLADEDALYWLELDRGEVRRFNPMNASPSTMSHDAQGATAFAQDELSLFWLEPASGKVKRLPKPGHTRDDLGGEGDASSAGGEAGAAGDSSAGGAGAPVTAWGLAFGESAVVSVGGLVESGGAFYVVGHTAPVGGGDKDIFVAKMDLAGHLIWSKKYGSPSDDWVATDSGSVAVPIEGGGIAFAGARDLNGKTQIGEHWVLSIAPDGQPLWNTTLAGEMDGYSSLGTLSDGRLLVAGRSSVSFWHSNLVALDASSGTPGAAAAFTYGSKFSPFSTPHLETAGAFSLVSGSVSPEGKRVVFFAFLSPDPGSSGGQARTFHMPTGDAYGTVRLCPGDHLCGLGGRLDKGASDTMPLLWKSDGQGATFSWGEDRYVKVPGFFFDALPDGEDLVVVGQLKLAGTDAPVVARVSPDGVFRWRKRSKTLWNGTFRRILPHPEGGYVIAGDGGSPGGNRHVFIQRIGSGGEGAMEDGSFDLQPGNGVLGAWSELGVGELSSVSPPPITYGSQPPTVSSWDTLVTSFP